MPHIVTWIVTCYMNSDSNSDISSDIYTVSTTHLVMFIDSDMVSDVDSDKNTDTMTRRLDDCYNNRIHDLSTGHTIFLGDNLMSNIYVMYCSFVALPCHTNHSSSVLTRAVSDQCQGLMSDDN